DPLENVAKERDALKRLFGDRFSGLEGTFLKVRDELQARPRPAVLHYAGHGTAVEGGLPGHQNYALRLEDREFDLNTFRHSAAWLDPDGARGPLVLLNACEVGRADGAYGWVEGWGPAALETGAAGFIGGLWSLGDSGAEAFAEAFYTNVVKGMTVVEALRQARARYKDSGD